MIIKLVTLIRDDFVVTQVTVKYKISNFILEKLVKGKIKGDFQLDNRPSNIIILPHGLTEKTLYMLLSVEPDNIEIIIQFPPWILHVIPHNFVATVHSGSGNSK